MAGTPRLERAPGIGLRVVAASALQGPAKPDGSSPVLRAPHR